MQRAPISVREQLIGDRCQQRMRELEPLSIALEDARRHGVGGRGTAAAGGERTVDHGRRGPRQRGGDLGGRACGLRQQLEPLAHELLEARRDGQLVRRPEAVAAARPAHGRSRARSRGCRRSRAGCAQPSGATAAWSDASAAAGRARRDRARPARAARSARPAARGRGRAARRGPRRAARTAARSAPRPVSARRIPARSRTQDRASGHRRSRRALAPARTAIGTGRADRGRWRAEAAARRLLRLRAQQRHVERVPLGRGRSDMAASGTSASRSPSAAYASSVSHSPGRQRSTRCPRADAEALPLGPQRRLADPDLALERAVPPGRSRSSRGSPRPVRARPPGR